MKKLPESWVLLLVAFLLLVVGYMKASEVCSSVRCNDPYWYYPIEAFWGALLLFVVYVVNCWFGEETKK